MDNNFTPNYPIFVGMRKISVAGWQQSSDFQKAANVASSLEHLYPNSITVEIIEHKSHEAFAAWLPKVASKLHGASVHGIAAIAWLDDSEYIGGIEDFLDYARGVGSGVTDNLRAVPVEDPSVSSSAIFDYDLIVIGGGSGGLATAKEASALGARVALLDFVKPSPQGSSWGLGGTCVNVGCIPKKLFHHAALNGESMHDSAHFGWNVDVNGHDWETMVSNVRDYILSLNFGYKVSLREKGVKYLNKLGVVMDAHTVKSIDKKGKEEMISAERILIAVGGRPKNLDCPGGELAITSDDMFFLSSPPGKTLVVGASYVALECASFLSGFGYDTTVMIRSILLRGFDQQMAGMVGDAMEKNLRTKFIHESVPQKLEKMENGKIKVTWKGGQDIFDTVLAAIGRDADTKGLGLNNAQVKVGRTGKVIANQCQTNVPSIFAIGDCVQGMPELTPVAIALGRNLAHRVYGDEKLGVNMKAIPTAIFAGLEYGCVGISEDEATETLGDNLEVYHTYFTPLQWTVPKNREYNQCYAKVLCDKSNNNRVVGMHILSPEAGEIIQAYGVSIKLGMTFRDLSDLIGIHPTIGEELCLLTMTKSSGGEALKSGC